MPSIRDLPPSFIYAAAASRCTPRHCQDAMPRYHDYYATFFAAPCRADDAFAYAAAIFAAACR